MKNTGWLVVVWAVMVLGAIAGENVWDFCRRVCLEMRQGNEMVGDSFGTDSVEGSGGADVEKDLYDPENTFHLPLPKKAIGGFDRFEQEYVDKNGKVEYRLLLDFPEKGVKHCRSIRSWLLKETESAMLSYEDSYGEDGQVKYKHLYQGDSDDRMALGKCMADYLFEIGRCQYGDSAEHFPAGLFQYFTMAAVDAAEKYVTYHLLLRNYYGGTHELYMDRLVSYDPVSRDMIDWDCLFLPQYRDSVLVKVSEVAMKDEKFLYWRGRNFLDDEEECALFFLENGSVELNPNVHHVGLYQGGVVFSYQPYALDCFAAGDFHFVVPGENLKPYMTQQGKLYVTENRSQ